MTSRSRRVLGVYRYEYESHNQLIIQVSPAIRRVTVGVGTFGLAADQRRLAGPTGLDTQ